MRIARSAIATAVFATALLPVSASAQVPDAPTFADHVAPIFYESCVNCHRPGQIAPMSLISYQEARPWARSIKTKVETRAMPPWHLDRRIGIQDFLNDPSLTEDQIATIVKWVDTGAPQGNPADTPVPPEFAPADAWQIGEPDLVVRFPTYTVPAAGPDIFGSLYTDFGLTEDRYITAIQTKPVGDKARQVVHHALSYAVEQDESGERMGGGTFLVEYASGKQAEVYPEGTGLKLPSDSEARLSYHLHSIGEDVDAVVELGINFLPVGVVPEHTRYSKQLGGSQGTTIGVLDIPSGRSGPDGRLRAIQPGGPDHDVPAAYAHAWQVSVHRVHLPDPAGPVGNHQLRLVRLQLAHELQLRRRCHADHSPRHDPACHHLA